MTAARRRRTVPLVGAAVVALLLAGCAGGTVDAAGGSAASDEATATRAPSAASSTSERIEDQGEVPGGAPSPDPDPDPPSPSPTPSAAPSPTPSPTPRAATSADAAGFLRDAAPAGVEAVEGVAVDVDGDGTKEVVLRGVRDGRGWVAVAAWDGVRYEVVADDLGGPATRVVDLRVADVTGDDVREVVLEVAGEGVASIALWSLPRPDRLRPLRATGGCHDGDHVYGVVGASLVVGDDEDGPLDVVATCDDSPLPVADWSTQRWRWTDGAFVHVPAPDPSPEPDGPGNGGNGGNGNGNGGQPPGQDPDR